MDNSTVCPKCGRAPINGILMCKCVRGPRRTDEYPLPPWNLPVKHEQQDKLDKIIALLEEIKERM